MLKRNTVIKPNFFYSDTGSLLFQMQTPNPYEDMLANKTSYHLSEYSLDCPNHNVENKKVVGKFKDKCNGVPIAEFVGLRPKMHSILQTSGFQIRKAKRVQRVVVKNDLHQELYKKCLF